MLVTAHAVVSDSGGLDELLCRRMPPPRAGGSVGLLVLHMSLCNVEASSLVLCLYALG